MTTDHPLGERITKLETLYEHLDEKLDDIKAAQVQQAASTRRLEDQFVQVGAWKMAIVAFLPILGGVIGAKFTAITNFLGFK